MQFIFQNRTYLEIDQATGRTKCVADIVLHESGIVVAGVTITDLPDGTVDIQIPPGAVKFAAPVYEQVFKLCVLRGLVERMEGMARQKEDELRRAEQIERDNLLRSTVTGKVS